MVIWGKKDHTIYIRTAKKLKRNVPTIELKIIPDAHHDPMETHPQQFNEMLVNFLNAHNP